jgi:hypothetical protein
MGIARQNWMNTCTRQQTLPVFFYFHTETDNSPEKFIGDKDSKTPREKSPYSIH